MIYRLQKLVKPVCNLPDLIQIMIHTVRLSACRKCLTYVINRSFNFEHKTIFERRHHTQHTVQESTTESI